MPYIGKPQSADAFRVTPSNIDSALKGAVSGSNDSEMTLATASIAAITASISRIDSEIDTNAANITLATASIAAITASLGQPVNTDSNVTFGVITSGDINSTGTITATEIHTTFVSSSIAVSSGSNTFGDDTSDSHQFTGSLNVSGALNLNDGDAVFGATATVETGLNLESGTFTVKNATSDSNGLKISQGGSDASNILNHYDGTLNLGVANSVDMTLKGGKVGIGVSAPSYRFDVVHDSHNGTIAQFGGDSGDGNSTDIRIRNTHQASSSTNETTRLIFELGSTNAGIIEGFKEADGTSAGNRTGGLAFYTSKANSVTEKMRIDSDGVIQLRDGMIVTKNNGSSTNAYMSIGHDADYGQIGAGESGIWGVNNNDMIFGTNDTLRMTIAATGTVTVTQASAQIGLSIDHDADAPALSIDAESTTANVIVVNADPTTTGNVIDVTADSLTTGRILKLMSDSSDNSSRYLVYVQNDNASSSACRVGYYQQDANEINSEFKSANGSFTNSTIYIPVERSSTDAFNFIRTFTTGDSDSQHALRGNGEIDADGAYSSGGADYAEYFESKDGKAITVGITVKLDGDKVVACEDGDTPIGVVRPSSNSVVIGNSAPFKWASKYLKDDYGAYIKEEYTLTEWIDGKKEDGANNDISYHTDKIPSDVIVPSDAVVISKDGNGNKLMRNKLNPDYDESKTYQPRKERDEWCLIGLLGQIPITKGQPISSNWIKMKDVSDTVEMYFVK